MRAGPCFPLPLPYPLCSPLPFPIPALPLSFPQSSNQDCGFREDPNLAASLFPFPSLLCSTHSFLPSLSHIISIPLSSHHSYHHSFPFPLILPFFSFPFQALFILPLPLPFLILSLLLPFLIYAIFPFSYSYIPTSLFLGLLLPSLAFPCLSYPTLSSFGFASVVFIFFIFFSLFFLLSYRHSPFFSR